MLLLHLLGVIIWIGGMYFAHFCLRPAAMELPPPQRLQLFVGVFRRFFPSVWVAIALIVGSGVAMMGRFGGMAAVPVSLHIMLALGLVMIANFSAIWFVFFRRMKALAAAENWPAAAGQLAWIRRLVVVNLSLGVLIICVYLLLG